VQADPSSDVARSPDGKATDGPRAPRQERSQQTLERIIEATRRLFDGRDFESLGIQEICEAANVSRSSFYARFPNKTALLTELYDRHRKMRLEMLAKQNAQIDWDAMSIGSVVSTCIALYVEDRRSLDPFLRSMVVIETNYPQISAQRAELDSFTMSMIRDHFMQRLGSEDPALARRLEFGIRSVAAIIQEAIQPPHRFAKQMGFSDVEFVKELTLLFCNYAGIDPDTK